VFLAVNLKDHTLIQDFDPYAEIIIGLLMIISAGVLLAFIIKSCISLQVKETQRLRRLKYEQQSLQREKNEK